MRMRKHCILAAILIAVMPLALAGDGISFRGNYRGEISISGKMTLKGMWSHNKTTFDIETNFTELIPKSVEQGSYTDVVFQGTAAFHSMRDIRGSNLEFTGILKIEDFNLWVNFRVKFDPPLNLKELKYSANGTLDVVITELSQNLLGVKVYPAWVNASGYLNLKSYVNWSITATVSVKTNFKATIPTAVEPGTYDGNFLGTAIVSGGAIKFSGIINVDGYNFWVKFVTEKSGSSPSDGFYSADGAMQVTITEIPLEELGVTWVMVRGNITQYGDEEAYGKLIAHGKIGEWFNVFGGFFIGQEPTMTMPENVPVSFYHFKLKNYADVELNYEGKALYIEGYWNVYNVTRSYFDSNFTSIIVPIVDGGYGELNVTLGGEVGNFTLNIDGIQEISGTVVFYHVKYCLPSDQRSYRFGIPLSDLNGDWKVSIHDVMKIAKSYGSMIGKRGYSFEFDFNFDFQVNILDLFEIAKFEFGQEY